MLAVFLPILLLSSLHVHQSAEAAEETCVDCLHNHCGGHLTQTTVHMDDCVLCQFLTLPMLAAVAVVVTIALKKGVRTDYLSLQATYLRPPNAQKNKRLLEAMGLDREEAEKR